MSRSLIVRAARRVGILARNGFAVARRSLRGVLWRLHGKIGATATTRTKQGRLTVYTADQFIGKGLFVLDGFEHEQGSATVSWLRDQGRIHARGTGTILDIGANIGVISIGMLTHLEFKSAIAIEPDPANFSLLEHNARQNNFDGTVYTCLPFAVSDTAEFVEFELSGDNFGDHRVRMPIGPSLDTAYGETSRQVIRIQSLPLDELLATISSEALADISVVWIDTQGHEAHVLRGGSSLFSRDIPVICEIWPYGLKRAGTSIQEFCRVASLYWSVYAMLQDDRFEIRPISSLAELMESFREADAHENVIFLQ